MDTTATYREILKHVILQYAKLRPSHGDIKSEVVFDETHDRYALMQVGWDRGRRVRGNIFYAALRDGKVYIEYDGIGYGISDDLVLGGIPEEDIVLAFLPDAPTLAETRPQPRAWQGKSGIAAMVSQNA